MVRIEFNFTDEELEAIKKNGLQVNSVKSRIRRGMDRHEAIYAPRIEQDNLFRFTEEEKRVMRENDIKEQTVKKRIHEGMSRYDAVHTPNLLKRPKYLFTDEEKESMEKGNISRSLVLQRMKSGMPREKAVSIPKANVYIQFTDDELAIMKKVGISRNTVIRRLREGMNREQAVRMLKDKRSEKKERFYIDLTDEEKKMMEINNLSRGTVNRRIKGGMTREEAISTPNRYGHGEIDPWSYQALTIAQQRKIRPDVYYQRMVDGWDPLEARTVRADDKSITDITKYEISAARKKGIPMKEYFNRRFQGAPHEVSILPEDHFNDWMSIDHQSFDYHDPYNYHNVRMAMKNRIPALLYYIRICSNKMEVHDAILMVARANNKDENQVTEDVLNTAEKNGIPFGTFANRIINYNMSVEEAATKKPLKKYASEKERLAARRRRERRRKRKATRQKARENGVKKDARQWHQLLNEDDARIMKKTKVTSRMYDGRIEDGWTKNQAIYLPPGSTPPEKQEKFPVPDELLPKLFNIGITYDKAKYLMALGYHLDDILKKGEINNG